MSDLCQSSLFEPTAPSENLLRRATNKKQPKIVDEKKHDDKKQVSASPTTSSRTSHSLVSFLDYFALRRKINNNNNNNKFNHEHLSKVSESQDGGSLSPAGRGSTMLSFFRSKQSSDPPVRKSVSDKETLQSDGQVDDANESGSLRFQAKGETGVLCHGLLTKTEDIVSQKGLLSHSDPDIDSPSEQRAHENGSNELSNSLEAVGKPGGEMPSIGKEETSKNEKFEDSSELQEQMNSINLKRCKDAVMPHSFHSSVTLPAHSESLSIPPVIEEAEEHNADEPRVIEVFLPQREPPAKEPANAVFVPSSCDVPGTQGNTRKRNKLRHILRRLLNMNGSFRKEDKQWLVEEEEEDEEEEQVVAETNVDGEKFEAELKCAASRTPSTQEDTEAVTPEKKRRPGAKVMSC